jgi:hypothetical protein
MHSPVPPLDEPRQVLVMLRQARPARVPQVLGPTPVLRGCEDEAGL